MTTKHTPGPWIAIPSPLRFHNATKPIFKDGIWHILPENDVERLPICIIDCGNDHDEETRLRAEIHARLIATAPELLEACKSAARAFADEKSDIEAEKAAIKKAYEQLCKAIIKAEGESL